MSPQRLTRGPHPTSKQRSIPRVLAACRTQLILTKLKAISASGTCPSNSAAKDRNFPSKRLLLSRHRPEDRWSPMLGGHRLSAKVFFLPKDFSCELRLSVYWNVVDRPQRYRYFLHLVGSICGDEGGLFNIHDPCRRVASRGLSWVVVGLASLPSCLNRHRSLPVFCCCAGQGHGFAKFKRAKLTNHHRGLDKLLETLGPHCRRYRRYRPLPSSPLEGHCTTYLSRVPSLLAGNPLWRA